MKDKKFDYNIIFITPSSSQPRYIKRALQIAKFCTIEVFSFKRGYYEDNTYPSQISYHNLGQISDGKYIRRIFNIIPAIFEIRRNIKKKRNCVYYALSFDCLVVARLCGMKRGYYEVGDLLQTDGFGKVFRFIEKRLLKNVLGLVVTSRYFYENYFKQKVILPQNSVYLIDNKLSEDLSEYRVLNKQFSNKQIVIGLIGLLRYRRPIEFLLEFVKERPLTHRIECFGDGHLRQLVESYSCKNIRYNGIFKSPEDLPFIYNSIDLNYVIYDNSSENVRLAIPNKLFESVFFGVPMVCAHDTSVGRVSTEWGVGKMIRINNKKNFVKDMESIDKEFLKLCSMNCVKTSSTELIDNGESVLEEMLTTTLDQKRNTNHC